MIPNDPIVEEVRKAREAHAAQFNYDLSAICKDLRQAEKQLDREVVTLNPKPLEDKLAG